jgi:hypothetical protein
LVEKKEYIPIFAEFRYIRGYQDYDSNGYYFAFTLPHENIEDGSIVPKVLIATKKGLLAPERVMKEFGVVFKPLKSFDVERIMVDVKFLERYNELIDKIKEDVQNWKERLSVDNPGEKVLSLVDDCSRVEVVLSVHHFLEHYLPILLETLQKHSEIFGSILDSIKELQKIVEECRVKSLPSNSTHFLYSSTNLLEIYEKFPNILYRIIKAIIDYYIDYEDEDKASDLVALWTMGTYCYTLFDHYPILNFWGERSTGKTKNLELLECLAFNPIIGTSFSGSASFRLVEAYRTTVLVDETHQITRMPEFRDFLIAGFNKSGKAWRVEELKEKTFRPKSFEYFSPRALAGITTLQDILLDRAIKITMVSTLSEKRKRKPNIQDDFWKAVRTLCYIFAFTYYKEVRETYYNMNIDFEDPREIDLWKPILTLAKIVGVDLKEYAEQKIKEKHEEEEESRVDLLVLKIVALRLESDEVWVSLKDVADEINNRYKIDISSKQVGSVLRKRKIKERKISGGYVKYRVKRDELEKELKKEGLSIDKVKEQFAEELSPEQKNEIDEAVEEESKKLPKILEEKGGE